MAGATRYRLIAAAALAALCAVAGAALVLAVPGRTAGGKRLLPDLITLRPQAVYLTEGNHGTLRLRLDNTIANHGKGPLEVYPGDLSDECNPPGAPADGRLAFQRIFLDSNDPGSHGYFERSDDTESDAVRAGCMRFHPQHNHWHLEDFAHYELRKEPSGKVVGVSTKVGFCLIDGLEPDGLSDLPGKPGSGYYPFDPESPESHFCSQTSVNGLSIGWADIYTAGLQGQDIVVDGIRKGRYCLVSVADPVNLLEESNNHNNGHRTLLSIRPKQGTAEPIKGGC
jgi:hypothetical protein